MQLTEILDLPAYLFSCSKKTSQYGKHLTVAKRHSCRSGDNTTHRNLPLKCEKSYASLLQGLQNFQAQMKVQKKKKKSLFELGEGMIKVL